MTRFLLQRIGLMIPTIFFVSVIVFSLFTTGVILRAHRAG